MSPRYAGVALLLLAVPFAARTAETDNPYKNAKKGEWVSYKMSTQFGTQKIEGTLKQTVTAKDEKSVTVKIAMKFMGMEFPPQEQKIDLTKPFNPASGSIPGANNAKIEKLDSGKETVEVGGKKYECEWVKNKITVDAGGMKIETETKTWTSKSAPLAGLVKMESKLPQGNTTMEITGSGNE